MRLWALIIFFISLYTSTHCWKYFTTFHDLVMANSYPQQKWVHSEYRFGNCTSIENIFYTHVFLNSLDVLGKIIIRSWIDVFRIPTCIVIRGKSWAEDMVRSTAFNFQICVPRISYCHSHRRYKYYYYEWYIPEEFTGGIDWDLYFFGPPSPTW